MGISRGAASPEVLLCARRHPEKVIYTGYSESFSQDWRSLRTN
jgi:hypothetical protein